MFPVNTTFEMGYSAAEFERVLGGNFTGEQSPYQSRPVDTGRWRVLHPGQGFETEISIEAQPPRKLGLIELPVLKVHFTDLSDCAECREQFFSKFFKYFHKGGG